MIFRVVKVLAYMLWRIFGFIGVSLFRKGETEAWLHRRFLGWTDMVLSTFDAEVTVAGAEHLAAPPAGRKLIIMANHQSQLDIPCLARAAGRVIGFVAKRELSRIPVLNYWMLRIGCVFIDRADKRGAHGALEKAAREMTGKPLVVFPEGTRSKDGAILPFKLGGTRLALLSQAVIVPVLIEGSRDAVENRKPGAGPFRVRLTAFPPFDTRGMDESKASQFRIKEYVERCWHGRNAPG